MKKLLYLAVLCASQIASGHSKVTHGNITKAAVQYLAKLDARAACSKSLNDILQIGAYDDDALPRPTFHFTPRLSSFAASCNSIQWAFGSGLCSGVIPPWAFLPIGSPPLQVALVNEHSWPDAINNVVDASGKPSLRGLKDLGYVLHLLEDLTSPAHTRDDPHAFGFEADPVEAVDRVPGPLSTSDGLIQVGSAEALFSGLQTFSSTRFYSKDTVFQGNGPVAVAEDSKYFYDAEGRRIAYKGLRWQITKSPQDATIDSEIATEQFNELGPIAVRYAASLIKYYLDVASPQLEGCVVDFEEFTGPSAFTEPLPPLKVEGATISGGQILSNTTFLPVNHTNVYGTAFVCSGCSPILAIDFDIPVDGFSMVLMNGQRFTVQYAVQSDVGDTQFYALTANSLSGLAVVDIPLKKIKRVTVQSDTPQWDFLVDNLRFGNGSTLQ
jgi:hypothetical protein